MRALLVVPLLLLLACSERDRRCEHARDVMLTMWEQSIQDTLPDMPMSTRATFEHESRAAMARARKHFLPQCLALSPEGQACIARIDELAAADRDRRAELERCPKDLYGQPEPACATAARDRADRQTAPCQSVLTTAFANIARP
ncbi:hypothetical protein [Nannocystis sp. SCPEA4]|uniref:hypothetical protein n=1 Tax=Nannocystis sp. SCPEA4 TaxID=2996787 RepID=UPI00226DB029|nr:hypothetical protein [Nannocystis sp. SCPEA4]MCY1059550.1 hypothetical protein [Nannocystis sp. SCPEA4]